MIGTASGPGEHIFEFWVMSLSPRRLAPGRGLLSGMNPIARRMRDAYGSLEPRQASQCRGSIARGRRPAIGRFPCQMGHIETTAAFPGPDGRGQAVPGMTAGTTDPIRGVLRP